ncbi:acylphosphatase [Catellatospora coxensis]
MGFRPFVYTLAQRLHLHGHVGNDTEGVFIEAEGPRSALDAFLCALDLERPPLSVIDSMTAAPLPVTGAPGFAVVPSDASGPPAAQVTPDAATCEACLAETTGGAAAGRYAFTNCTHCGPRFTIVRDVPYDRPNTTMAGFAMCDDCAEEYADPADRRFHAQPVCCPACGPRLSLLSMDGSTVLAEGPTRSPRRRGCCAPGPSSRSKAWADTTWPSTPRIPRPPPGCAPPSTARTSRSR